MVSLGGGVEVVGEMRDDISCVNRDGIVREIVNSFEGGEVKEVWSNFMVRFEAVFKVVVEKV
jgi:hypothetical protein